MLEHCPDCEGTVSNKAHFCPHCGYPFDKAAKLYANKERRSHKRLPNGFGQISKIKGNLRNPYRAMVTVGKTPTGKPVCRLLKPVAYFPTYNEAYKALLKYNEKPYDITRKVTCNELYKLWSEEHFKTFDNSRSSANYSAAWKHCSFAYGLDIRELRPRHIKACIENAPAPTTKTNIKLVFGMMLDFAVENEMVERNVAREFSMPKSVAKERKEKYKGHTALSEEEVSMLSKHLDDPMLVLAYVQIYTGFRPSELLAIRPEHFDKSTMIVIGGSKTEAGRNRVVPIHPAIRSMVFDMSNDMKYRYYRPKVEKAMENIGITGHSPHDFRKTFVTLAKKYGVNEYAIKRIVGHSIRDLTESVYTERNIEWLHSEISKIPVL